MAFAFSSQCLCSAAAPFLKKTKNSKSNQVNCVVAFAFSSQFVQHHCLSIPFGYICKSVLFTKLPKNPAKAKTVNSMLSHLVASTLHSVAAPGSSKIKHPIKLAANYLPFCHYFVQPCCSFPKQESEINQIISDVLLHLTLIVSIIVCSTVAPLESAKKHKSNQVTVLLYLPLVTCASKTIDLKNSNQTT